MKFIKQVEAYQWDYDAIEFPDFIVSAFNRGDLFYGSKNYSKEDVYLKNAIGVGMLVIEGDWIVSSDAGVECVKDDVFRKSYSSCEDASETPSGHLNAEYSLMNSAEGMARKISMILKEHGDPYLEIRITDTDAQLVRIEQYLPIKEE